jgi:hypothetical protein
MKKVKEFFKTIFNNIKNLFKENELKTVAGTIAIGPIATLTALNIIYFPFLATWLLFIIPGVITIISIGGILYNKQWASTLFKYTAFLWTTIICILTLLTFNAGYLIFYAIPLFLIYNWVKDIDYISVNPINYERI